MKILLRIFAVIAGFLSVAFVLVFAIAAYFATVRSLVRDWIGALVFLSAAFLAARSVIWLWADSPFWITKRKRAEVFALVGFLLMWPVVFFAEKHSGDPVRAIVQLSAVLVAIFVYVVTRHLFTEEVDLLKMPNQAPQPMRAAGPLG